MSGGGSKTVYKLYKKTGILVQDRVPYSNASNEMYQSRSEQPLKCMGPQLTIKGTTDGCLTLFPFVTLKYRAKCISLGANNPQSEEPNQPQNLNVRDTVLLYLWLSYQGLFKNIAYVECMGNFNQSCICVFANLYSSRSSTLKFQLKLKRSC